MNAPRARVARRPVHGVLLLDKPMGLSSNQALQKAKWLLRAEKAGHTGTLDPLATGVLPLCFGAATKFSQMHLDADKSYEAIAVLGVQTSTGDLEGEVVAEKPVNFSPEQLQQAQVKFTGPIDQIPPMYSALKKDGKALYDYARAGIEVERESRHIVIYKLVFEEIDTGERSAPFENHGHLQQGHLHSHLGRRHCHCARYLRAFECFASRSNGSLYGCRLPQHSRIRSFA